ncbi:acetyl-CoA carboxylase biotin carboxyl carrier protein [Afifella marina]|uniref:Biotin carboxyl carrier protein of acetyl-CoA carboxylase n=1 Tax=Afifella marina DSM 2698 TaxID=1120955 RepID=A0A1G5MDD9_AFIMA|nr:acetyl-CoA carboxylase biotin carboxyl carrier protein [Afifella marina]MBK1622642.1 acetyl-CoA carboxylase, biotin carboxyl carrier protein [Afifella marina DSM 2698]MBK1625637.1 acetyl-CoA carboxylase, biotin carboxyl carrier protein [Afifella marina]MBK5917460.1 acetyl-CoA carboxylase, biotin carboxyl carrier protein [Afifella marina]RAI23404.1 acetyl-CoA carboxylase, biotin carboxyl carrier protein [Afifella marina DSM 2698]SCZ22751.1 acetyl-CoA carboxylase biotin carboxyl carrier prote
MAEKKRAIDKELVRELAELLKETELSEIEIENEDLRIRVARNLGPAPAANYAVSVPAEASPSARDAADASEAIDDPSRHPGCVPSPMVGTVYRAPAPGARPFVEIGDTVREGQTVLIVEAMKHMNEVAAPHSGRVSAVLVEDGQPVEYGEPLLIIE